MSRTVVATTQNLVKFSEDMSNASGYGVIHSTVTANAGTAPDNSNNAVSITDDATSNLHYLYTTKTLINSGLNPIPNGGTATLSCYLKAGTKTWAHIWITNTSSSAYFDLQNGVIGTTVNTTATSIISQGNGWYRCSITGPIAVVIAGAAYTAIGIANGDGLANYSGAGTGTIFAWGEQLVNANWPGTYIKTISSPVTTPIRSVGRRMNIRNNSFSMNVANANGRIIVPNTADMVIGTNSFWFATSYYPNIPALKAAISSLVCEYGSYTTNGVLLNIIGNSLFVYVNSAGQVTSCVGYIANTDWNRFFVTFNAGDAKVRMYNNGVLLATSSAITAWNITSTGNLAIAYANSLSGQGLSGDYQDFQYGVGSTVPSLSNVQADYYNGIVAPSCIHRYILNESSGTTAHDSIGTANGTLSAAAFYSSNNPWLPRRGLASGRTAGVW